MNQTLSMDYPLVHTRVSTLALEGLFNYLPRNVISALVNNSGAILDLGSQNGQTVANSACSAP